jgi:hypothetical protein
MHGLRRGDAGRFRQCQPTHRALGKK